ncbi:hypothetical protein [Carnobacterium mobile]|uniref:hypothetical protein n=1 Tax=Carnobacterium mobile TaxID=2750 RepID=UPI00055880EA|nr:hypothetical protein [Carnobacterium mobile]
MNSLFKQVLNNDAHKESASIHKKVLTESASANKEVLSSSSSKKVLDTKPNYSAAIQQPEPTIKCRLFKDKVFDSIDIPNEEFINFLPEKLLIDDDTITQLNIIAEDESCLHKNYDRREAPPVGYYGLHKNHILNIIRAYENKFNCSSKELENALLEGRIRKSTLPSGTSKGKTRVISLYEKDIEENQSYFNLLFIDLYHLFVPSGHAGLDSVTSLKRTYNDYKRNPTHIHEILKKEKFTWHNES